MRHRRPAWHVATVVETRPETPNAVRLVLDVPTWPGSEAGTHLDVRLTAPDGYQATRSYSVATSEPGRVVLGIDELPDGEVSPFLVREVLAGDELEIHGPLGSYFVWRPGQSGRPVQLIAGGSGVVPLYAMAAAHAAASDPSPFRLLYSVRTPAYVYFRDELAALAGPSFAVDHVYTRQAPPGWDEPAGRLTRDSLASTTFAPHERPRIFVCGSTGFVETVVAWLLELGHAAHDILTERFGGL
ncbi:FAD-binding oxidoreductase [Jiangella mangrovi]|uniref:Ferredoxin-NADP reductase n=1 Tax=Jiangella mangrovi TaxID=1524084 RepID=A0A7W9GUF6_9ACTN|nr:FAD-binding oxidoreductase [Jiangella mangrovi]MBB5790293.1 ferredoxin-NADP reductase [Jiangella mangrovi]